MAAPQSRSRRVFAWIAAAIPLALVAALVGCGATSPSPQGDHAAKMTDGAYADKAPSPDRFAVGGAMEKRVVPGDRAPMAGMTGMAATPPAAPTQEKYATFEDNTYQSAAANPVSTFSTDVNTASYSNLRRFFASGHLPPKDAVRIADLVNYFPYEYPNPKNGDPVAFTTDIAACPWQPKHHLCRIGLKAKVI